MDQAQLFGVEQVTTNDQRFERYLTSLARKHAKEVLTQIIVAAKAGDTGAAKLILDRIWPVPKSGKVAGVLLKPTRNAIEVRDAMSDVLQAVAAGRITKDDGAQLMAMLKDLFVSHTAGDLLPFGRPDADIESIDDVRSELTKRLVNMVNSRNENAAALPAPQGENATAQETASDVVIEVTPQSPPQASD